MSADVERIAGYDARAVQALEGLPVPSATKGFAGTGSPRATIAELVADKPGLFDGRFSFPALTLRAAALAQNVSSMSRFCRDHGVSLAPHVKTTMAPQVFAAQLDAGAWGLTVATITQAQVCRRFGVRRILLANELVDPEGIAWLAAELARYPDIDVLCYVDSTDGVALLDAALTAAVAPDPTRRLAVLVELGFEGGRTGCRSLHQARAVAAAVRRSRALSVAGVAGYEGGLAADRSATSQAAVRAFGQRLAEFADELTTSVEPRARPPVITAGGSVFPDLVAASLSEATAWATVVLRSGCYVTHDHGQYAELSPFTVTSGSPYALAPALEVWAQVLSRPEAALAIIGAGRRDVGSDQGLPVPLHWRGRTGLITGLPGARVSALNDQHAYLELPRTSELAVGDLVGLGVSHPCTTVDRWRYLLQIDDAHQVTGVLPTYF